MPILLMIESLVSPEENFETFNSLIRGREGIGTEDLIVKRDDL